MNQNFSVNFLMNSSTGKSLFYILLDWSLIFGSVYFLSQRSFILSVLVFFFVARQQHALAIIFHDATHFNLSKNKKLNDFMANLLCGYPLFYNLESFRYLHLKHHRNMLTEKDPDILLYRNYPQSLKKFIKKVMTDLSTKSYSKIIGYFNFDSEKIEINFF